MFPVKKRIASRVILGHDNAAFVYLIGKSSDREFKMAEFQLRCSIISIKVPNVKTVIGIATNKAGSSDIGYSSNILYINNPKCTKKEKEEILNLSQELG